MDTKYKIDNEGNIIEKVAKDKYEKISEEEQVKRAEEVKKMMNDKQNDRQLKTKTWEKKKFPSFY